MLLSYGNLPNDFLLMDYGWGSKPLAATVPGVVLPRHLHRAALRKYQGAIPAPFGTWLLEQAG